jgi:predicted nucleic acid-binding protein
MPIASCLVDTNILLRITRRSDPQHKAVDTALARLVGQGTTLYFTHQNIAELWNAMTRPIARNGLGLTVAEAEQQVRAIEAGMSLLPDSDAVLSGMAENDRALQHLGGSSARRAFSGGGACSPRQSHTHPELDGL